MKKLLVFGVIVLFLGLAIAPSINANVSKASIESELVEITVEASGIEGATPHTVKLTRQQFAEVEKLFNDIQTKLDGTKTMMDAIPIYYDAVVELNKYGLLPEGMNVDDAQKLVTGEYKHNEQTNLFRETSNISTNALCFVFGMIKNVNFLNLFSPLMVVLLIFSLPIFVVGLILTLITGIPILPYYLVAVFLTMASSIPLAFLNVILLDSDLQG